MTASAPITHDPYRSRTSGRPTMLPRQDPVIAAYDADGPLDEAALRAYERDGFLVREQVFSPSEVAAFLAECDALAADPEVRERPETILEPDSERIRSFFAIHRLDRRFAALAADERLRGVAEQILGGPVGIHQSRANLKPAFTGQPFHWHSDFETWHCEDGMPRMRALSASILLTDNKTCNGALMLIPASHWHYVVCVGETPADNHRTSLRRQTIGVPDEESLTWLAERRGIAMPTPPAGSVLFFDCNVLHASNGNLSPFPRHNLFFVYNRLDNALEEPFCGTPPRPAHVAERRPWPVG